MVGAADEPCEAWGRELADAVRKGDGDRTMLLIDFRVLVEESTRDGPEDLRRGFMAGAMKGMRKRGGVLYEVIPDVAQGGRFDLLRITEREDLPCARFRFASSDGGINYLDVKLRIADDGAVRGIDLYNHMSGEWMSEALRRFFLPMVRAQRQSVWDKLLRGKDKEWIEAALGLGRMGDLRGAGKNKEALKVYDSLPEGVRRQKSVQMVRLQAAQAVSEEEYKKAMREYLELYPDDPSAHLVGIDAHFMAGRFDDAVAGVEALDKAVGGDPYLGILKGNLLMAANRLDEARRSIQAALKAGPDWTDGHFALVDVELKAKRYKEVARLLLLLEERFEFEFDDLTQHEAYAGFVKSPEYQVWLARKSGKD
jgi:hypothetical protein